MSNVVQPSFERRSYDHAERFVEEGLTACKRMGFASASISTSRTMTSL
jgi:hypothetical protein